MGFWEGGGKRVYYPYQVRFDASKGGKSYYYNKSSPTQTIKWGMNDRWKFASDGYGDNVGFMNFDIEVFRL